MKAIFEGWLDLDLRNHGETSLCSTKEELGKFGLELDDTLIGQLKNFNEKKVRITIEEIM